MYASRISDRIHPPGRPGSAQASTTRFEILVDGHRVTTGGLAETAAHLEAINRDDAPLIRRPPTERAI